MFILKQLRRKKNVNQTDLAKAIGVSLRTIQLYEKKDANIPIKNLTKLAQYFDISIAELYSHESVNELGVSYDRLEAKFEKGHTINKLGPGKYLISAPFVVTEQYSSYLNEYENRTFIHSLPQIGFVIDQVSVSRYTAFEISNDSMDDQTRESIPKKSVVLGKLVPFKRFGATLKSNPNMPWVIIYKDSIMCKGISDYDGKKNTLACYNLNSSPEYSDFTIKVKDVQQFFMVIKKQVE